MTSYFLSPLRHPPPYLSYPPDTKSSLTHPVFVPYSPHYLPLHHHVLSLASAPYVSLPSPMLTLMNPVPYLRHVPCHFLSVTLMV